MTNEELIEKSHECGLATLREFNKNGESKRYLDLLSLYSKIQSRLCKIILKDSNYKIAQPFKYSKNTPNELLRAY